MGQHQKSLVTGLIDGRPGRFTFMLEFKIVMDDVKRVVTKLGKLPQAQADRLMQATDKFLLSVLRDSKTKPPRVPVDTGALQSSGFTEPCKREGKTITASIGYGGIGGVDYAVFVHDNANGRIKNYKRPGSGPFFLSTHLDARKPELNENLEHALGDGSKDLFS